MARFLQELLSLEEPAFTLGVRQLEEATGKKGVDVRLIADVTHKAHDVMRSLGLDIADSSPKEVYQALNSSVRDEKIYSLLFDEDYVLLRIDDEVVSFNIIDIIENSHHELMFEDRIVSHGRRSLRGELVNRYLESSNLKESYTREMAAGTGLLPDSDEGYSRIDSSRQRQDAPYILAVGDIFTDAFIELDPDEAISFKDEEDVSHLMMSFGSKPPYISSTVINSVGPSPNAAVSFARLGIKVGLLAFLGDDQTARESVAYLKKEGIDTSLMSLQASMKSNYYYVLRLGADRTILVKNEKYNYAWQDPAEVPDWVYLSLLSEDSWQLHEDLLAYLEANPGIKLAFQPGTFHFGWGVEKLSGIYKRSHIVVMNREEAVNVTATSYDDLHALCDGLHKLGPKVVVVTDGPEGSYASFDGKMLKIPNYPDPAPPVDRTGAGDAFASTIVASLAMGEPIDIAITRAPINSMSVVQKLGAQEGLLTTDQIKKYIDNAPSDYKAQEYSK